mgnify:CR=1 FL=1
MFYDTVSAAITGTLALTVAGWVQNVDLGLNGFVLRYCKALQSLNKWTGLLPIKDNTQIGYMLAGQAEYL